MKHWPDFSTAYSAAADAEYVNSDDRSAVIKFFDYVHIREYGESMCTCERCEREHGQ